MATKWFRKCKLISKHRCYYLYNSICIAFLYLIFFVTINTLYFQKRKLENHVGKNTTRSPEVGSVKIATSSFLTSISSRTTTTSASPAAPRMESSPRGSSAASARETSRIFRHWKNISYRVRYTSLHEMLKQNIFKFFLFLELGEVL